MNIQQKKYAAAQLQQITSKKIREIEKNTSYSDLLKKQYNQTLNLVVSKAKPKKDIAETHSRMFYCEPYNPKRLLTRNFGDVFDVDIRPLEVLKERIDKVEAKEAMVTQEKKAKIEQRKHALELELMLGDATEALKMLKAFEKETF